MGLAQVKAHGGVTIVQDPEEAQYDGMPVNALAGTHVDFTLSCREIAGALSELAAGRLQAPAGNGGQVAPSRPAAGEMLSVLCPDCGGTLWADDEGGIPNFRCHVGHRFSARSLLAGHAEDVERAMWTAVRSLEDRATLLRRMAQRVHGITISRRHFEQQAGTADQQAQAIREAIAALDDTAIEPMTDPNGATS
jgi:two-component system chemotaxis response regulator CheB